jgi:hypothetical protein
MTLAFAVLIIPYSTILPNLLENSFITALCPKTSSLPNGSVSAALIELSNISTKFSADSISLSTTESNLKSERVSKVISCSFF